MTSKLIKANTVKCSRQECKNMGFRWIAGDPDIKPFALCELHCIEFKKVIMKIMKGEKHGN